MNHIVNLVGSFFISIMMCSVPALLACSFCLNWDGLFQFVLVISTAVEVIGLSKVIFQKVDEGE